VVFLYALAGLYLFAILIGMSKRIALLCTCFFMVVGGMFVTVSYADERVNAREEELRRELQVLEAEIQVQEEILKEQQRESVSIERDISILTTQISEARLKIRKKNLNIEQLGSDIGQKTATISDLEARMARGKESLAEIIRKTNAFDQISLPEIILSNDNLSNFFQDLDSYTVLKNSLNVLFQQMRDIREVTEVERSILDEKRRAEIDVRVSIESEKRTVERKEDQKRDLLLLSKAEERTYQAVLNEREARAAEIRSALFALRDSASIPFGDALAFAESASKKVGVRPAFILAILTQESNLGENVGTCNRIDDPPSKGWREIMKPSRDQEPYLAITKALGLNPDTMPLSCPWGNGWGGAMGPSQFIPSTWILYESRISKVTGNNPPNPWNPEDAITATSIFLADLGADEGGYSAEREAALRYYAGGNWWKDSNAFYGNSVMKHAQNIQENMIDPLNAF